MPVLEVRGTSWANATALEGAIGCCGYNPLLSPQLFSGLVFTSGRAVEEVRRWADAQDPAAAWAQYCREAWRGKPVFAVGPKTGRDVQGLLGVEGLGITTGAAASLADEIVRLAGGLGDLQKRPLLFVCGDGRRDELPDALAAAHVGSHPAVQPA